LYGFKRIHRGDRPVAAAGDHRARLRQAANRIEPARALRPQHRYCKLSYIRISKRPQRLKVGNHAEPAEARHILRIEQLKMSDLMARIAAAIFRLREFEGIERIADGAVADGVNVNLKAGAVKRRR